MEENKKTYIDFKSNVNFSFEFNIPESSEAMHKVDAI